MIDNQNLMEQLKILTQEDTIHPNEDLKAHTYIHLGGKADYLITPKSYHELQKIVRFSTEKNIPLKVIGNGSKLIILDGGLRGIVISLEKLKSIQVEDDTIISGAGANIMDVSNIAYLSNLSGLEFACGIPGSVGGTIYMNAGAYDGEIKDVLKSCLVIDKKGKIIRKTNADLNFSYRYSNIKENNEIVIEAVFQLNRGSQEDIKNKMEYFTEQRKLRQPLEFPSCGSVFKRPNGHYAGQLIQNCYLQGYRVGGAEVSKKHAGFIVNVDNATAKDYVELIEYIKKVVKEKYNIDLNCEVEIIGEP